MTNKSLLPSVASIWRTPAINRFRNDMDELFDSFLSNAFTTNAVKVFDDLQTNGSFPKINVSETETSYGIEIAIAGFNKDDVKLELKENTLLISAEKKEEKEEEEKNYLRREISSRSFSRAVRFPCKVTSNVTANYRDGIINVDIAKDIKKDGDCGIKINID